MSNAEQDAALLRLIRERSDAKRRRTLLESELRTAGRSLWSIGGILKDVVSVGNAAYAPSMALSEVNKAPRICDMESIRQMLQELDELQCQIETMDRQARDLGVD